MKCRLLDASEKIPFDLLLLADETLKAINKYLSGSSINVYEEQNEILGVYLLYPLNEQTIEIKNIAVKTAYQGRGIGTFMLKDAEHNARAQGYKNLIIGTAATGLGQIALYKKAGFKYFETRKNFFLDNYDQLIYEKGQMLRDMAVFSKVLF